MFISWYNFETHPAKELSTLAADHLIAPINLLNYIPTAWTLLSALWDVVLIHQFIDLSYVLVSLGFQLFFWERTHWKVRTSLKHMVLLPACQTEYKPTLLVSAEVLHFINFCRWRTLLYWTPSKVLHLVNGLVDWVSHHFVNLFFIKLEFFQVNFIYLSFTGWNTLKGTY